MDKWKGEEFLVSAILSRDPIVCWCDFRSVRKYKRLGCGHPISEYELSATLGVLGEKSKRLG